MAKRKIPTYVKILTGMMKCYGTDPEDRDCSSCPYDKYNDVIFGDGYVCNEKLNKDAKKFFGNMEFFSYCRDCQFFEKEYSDDDHGHCRSNDWDVMENEYCSRANRKDLL